MFSLTGRREGAQFLVLAVCVRRLASCIAGGDGYCGKRSSQVPCEFVAHTFDLVDGVGLLFRVSCVGVTEGERGPARLEMVASTLAVTGAVALVAVVAAGVPPPHVSSFLNQYHCLPLPVALLLYRRLGRTALLHCQLRNGRGARLQRVPSAAALASSPLVRQVAMPAA